MRSDEAVAEIDFAAVGEFAKAHHRLGERWLHGPAHWERVEMQGRRLAAQTEGVDEAVVRFFGILHDGERHNEWYDAAHGRRAAQLARHLRDRFFAITDDQLDLLAYACE